MSKVDFVDDIDPKSFVKNTKKAVVLNLDYYNELKRKADFVDKMISPSANAIYKELNELRSKAEELDYLARIGRAMEKAFESGFSINQMHSVLSNVDYCIYDKESLLNWAESEGE